MALSIVDLVFLFICAFILPCVAWACIAKASDGSDAISEIVEALTRQKPAGKPSTMINAISKTPHVKAAK